MDKPALVFDGDGHICEPPAIWEEYTQARYREQVIRVVTEGGRSKLAIEGRVREPGRGAGPAEASIPGGMEPGRKLTWDDILPGSHDPNERLKVFDAEGIDRGLMFPTIYLLWGDIRDPDVAAETCRAYNDWMSDFCRADPERLHGMGLVPLQDPERAAAEARRLPELGLDGFVVRPERFDGLALFDERCDPLWDVARSEGLAVGVHGSFGTHMPGFATARYPDNQFFEHMIAHPFGQMAAMMDLIAGGVLDRFPGLKVGFFESGLGWLPYWLDRLDEHFEVMGHLTPWLARRPSEIFREQCFVSMEADERQGLAWLAGEGLSDCVLWGTDYPHFDCTYPGAWQEVAATFEAVGGDVAERVVGTNPLRYISAGK